MADLNAAHNLFFQALRPTRQFTHAESVRFSVIVALRTILFGIIVFLLDRFVQLGTSPFVVWTGGALGVVVASTLARSALTHLGFAVAVLSVWAVQSSVIWLLGVMVGGEGSLKPYAIVLHSNLTLIAFTAAALATWAFWRIRHTTTVEVLLVAIGCVGALAGHRDYRFDTPRIITDIAWYLRVEPLTILILGGIGAVALTLIYLYAAVLPGQPLVGAKAQAQHFHSARPHYVDAIVFSLVVLGLVGFVSRELFLYYRQIALTRTANGVGQENTEGLSPLTFHSALGSTNQPAGVVRLEGDYKENPFSPMLYMRTSALSKLSGNQLVIAPSYLDRDVSNTLPDQSFNGGEDPALDRRVPVAQSVYLLADHNSVFTIDFPLSIRPMKNPNPGRFKGAYRAVSLAPTYSLKEFLDAEVGDPRWSPDVRAHYLESHADPRYKALAEKVTQGAVSPLAKVKALTEYLSKTSIYTLSPGHDVKPDADPVAPFLFGDHRGYCVHFAHALVYMFRSLGIPSRIGTGYLTDLSESKDGHILLRMSDRHAWSEVYIKGKGWVPFDIQPDTVENHAGSDVDMKLLEELMGMLGPGEEILPSTTETQEPTTEVNSPILTVRGLGIILFSLFVALVAWKFYLRWGWILPSSTERKLRWSYRAVVATLLDVGYSRRRGETKLEFRKRLLLQEGINTLSLAELMNLHVYGEGRGDVIDEFEISERRARDFQAFMYLPLWKRVVGYLNPRSVFASLGGSL